MNQFHIQIADFKIRLTFGKSTKSYLKKSILNKIKEFIVAGNIKNVDIEIIFWEKNNPEYVIIRKKLYIKICEKVGNYKILVSNDIKISQFQIVLRTAIDTVVRRKHAYIVHCSSVIINKKASLFIGKSHKGKSTIVKMLANNFIPYTDDIGIMKKVDKKYFLYQTPIQEKNNFTKKIEGYEIEKIILLDNFSKFLLEPVNIFNNSTMSVLSQQLFMNVNRKDLVRLILEMDGHIYRMNFLKNDQQNIVYNLLKK